MAQFAFVDDEAEEVHEAELEDILAREEEEEEFNDEDADDIDDSINASLVQGMQNMRPPAAEGFAVGGGVPEDAIPPAGHHPRSLDGVSVAGASQVASQTGGETIIGICTRELQHITDERVRQRLQRILNKIRTAEKDRVTMLKSSALLEGTWKNNLKTIQRLERQNKGIRRRMLDDKQVANNMQDDIKDYRHQFNTAVKDYDKSQDVSDAETDQEAVREAREASLAYQKSKKRRAEAMDGQEMAFTQMMDTYITRESLVPFIQQYLLAHGTEPIVFANLRGELIQKHADFNQFNSAQRLRKYLLAGRRGPVYGPFYNQAFVDAGQPLNGDTSQIKRPYVWGIADAGALADEQYPHGVFQDGDIHHPPLFFDEQGHAYQLQHGRRKYFIRTQAQVHDAHSAAEAAQKHDAEVDAVEQGA